MISRRSFLAAHAALAVGAQSEPANRVGLQLYSLRAEADKDLPGCLALVRGMGFRELEVDALRGRTPAQFRALLDQAGLRATSTGANYDRLLEAPDAVAEQARILGAEYVVCGTIPHRRRHLTLEDCPPVAENWNRCGDRLGAAGLKLCYHIHGIEFDPAPGGTVFDALARQTDPHNLNFEMDVFWVVYGFQDPVRLLRRYPGRFPLMHLKDVRPGLRLGGIPAEVSEDDSVTLGTGLVDIPAVLRATREAAVRHIYIEDEVVGAAPQIRRSLRFLETVKW